MNVILLEKVGNLGDLGEEINVKNGFARNYLLPQGKAVRATDENRSVFEARRAELEAAASDRLAAAQARAEKLEDVSVTIVVKAGDEGKLYGSVGTQDIAEALSQQGIEITKSEVRLPEGAIRSTGEYQIAIHLHSDIDSSIQLIVVPE